MTAAEHAPARLRRAPAEKAARAVLPACGVAWTAAEIMHVSGIPWLDIGGGAAVLAAAAGARGYRSTAAWLLATGAWGALAARFGPLADPGLFCPVTLAWGALGFTGWRLARRHPAVAEARDRRAAAADWLARRDRWGLSRTHLLDWEETRLGEWYLIDVRGTGKRASAIVASDVAERIAEDEILPPGRVRLKRHRLAGRVEISIRRTDPWAHPIPHPAVTPDHEVDLSGPYSITQPAVVGQDPETGKPLSLLLCGPGGGRNVNVVATLESGKTTLLSCISERTTAAADALLFRINLSLKGDNERHMWGPACHLTALGPSQKPRALKVLRTLEGIIEYRARQPKTGANWIPSPGDPHLVLIIDEIDALTEIPACRQSLERLSSKGREFGFTCVRAGQRGTAEWTGGGNIRAVDGVFCIGKVNRSMEAMHAAGDLGLRLPDMAEYGEGRAGVWAIADLADSAHQAGRGFNLCEPADVRRIVAGRARQQPDLQPELKTFLGKTYEELLSTDVFARWVRDQQEPAAAAVAHPRPDAPPEPAPASPQPGRAPVAVLADPLAAYDQDMEAHMETLGPEDDLRRRWIQQGERIAETRRELEAAAAEPPPDIPREQLVAHAEAQWDEKAQHTEIPPDMRERLLALVAGEGISARQAVNALGIPEASRAKVTFWLNRLRWEGVVQLEGKGRAARWKLVTPPPETTPE